MVNDEIWNLIAKKLSGEANPDELLALEKALRQDPDLHYSLQAIQDVWESNPGIQPDLIEKAFEKHEHKLRSVLTDYPDPSSIPPASYPFSEKNGYRRMRPVLILTGLIIVFLGIYYAVQPPPKKPAEITRKEINKPSEVFTQYGSRTKLLLPDGSSVWLNSGSRLTYDSAFGEVNREVSLTGEAFFDVAKNKQKPFVIHTGNINIKVLGTSFNVKSYPGDRTIETSLIQGRIEVTFKDHSQSSVILHPNQKLIVENDPEKFRHEKISGSGAQPSTVSINPVSHFGPDSLISETAWVDNLLVFQDESFPDLAKKMERWYGIRMIIEDPKLDTLHFTGSFEKENIQQALKALQLFTKFNFTVQNGEVHIQKTY